MELFRGVNVDWLGKKWYFLAFSLVFSVSGLLSILFWHHIKLGVDFRGGTLVYVQFEQPPNMDRIRQAIDRAGIHDAAFRPTAHRRSRWLFRWRRRRPRIRLSIPGGRPSCRR